MQHIPFGLDTSKAEIAILIKSAAFNKSKIEAAYIIPQSVILTEKFIAFDLAYQSNNKCTAAFAKEYIADLLPEIDALNITTILVCDPNYFKSLTKEKKTDVNYGYIFPCAIKNYEHINIVLAPNYQAILYNPAIQQKLDIALNTLIQHVSSTYTLPGTGIIHSAYYPETIKDIQTTLNDLHKYPKLTCDIETLSLDFWKAGISTISFAWNKHEGIAFGVQRGPNNKTQHPLSPVEKEDHSDWSWRESKDSSIIYSLLIQFFEGYKGNIKYHNAGFDIKVLVYELWMRDLADYPLMITGIQQLTKNFDDTKLITYLATNNAVQNILSLKELAAPFAGNYAQENIKDTNKIPLPKLLKYNLVDALSTWYVNDKYEPIMIVDQQEQLYTNLFKPTVLTLLQTELCGMPINPDKVQIAKSKLTAIVKTCTDYFNQSKFIQDFHFTQIVALAATMTAKAKKKVYSITDPIIAREVFNPNSDTQLRTLIFDYMGYDIIDLTKGKQASTGKDTIKKLLVIAKTPEHKEIFEYLIKLADASIILSTFIPAFERAVQLPDGSWRLYGNFNLGGTQSLRLSSSNPNLQNIPSHSVFAKIIKECFMPDTGWLYIGSDFDALEDKTNALLTKDPQKLKIYTDGFCGHCLRAFYYYPDKIKNIVETVASINSIKKLYPEERQESKEPTFLLTYGGTFHGLINNCGFSKAKAKQIETTYHKLYAVADAWIDDLVEKAKNRGWIPLAFGGRIRTPLLAKTVGKTKVPFMAQKEARSAGNAATQSYCILTLRAMNEFRERVWASPYIYDILPSATTHDSAYYMSRDDSNIIKWANDNLIDCMAWQQLPELQHPTIKISSGLEIYWPSWANAIEIPNKASKTKIKAICTKAEKEEKAKQLIKP